MGLKLIANSFPLSPMQQGMLFHYLKEPRSGVDIEQLVVHCRRRSTPTVGGRLEVAGAAA